MGLLSSIPLIGKVLDNTTDIVKEVVVDKDARNKIIGNITLVKEQVYLAELSTRTIPWVDALHKMGRQILAALSIGAAVYLKTHGYELDMQTLLLLGAPNIAYQMIKGKGK